MRIMMTMMLTMLELSLRNKMIRLGLFMEMGAVALGSGAVVGGVFGMNLTNGLEDHPAAFMVTLGGISLVMTTIFAGKHPPSQYQTNIEYELRLKYLIFSGFNAKYNKLNQDTTNAHSFLALKNFFTYVDDLEFIVSKKELNKQEFKEALNQLTGLKVTEEESEFIFRMFDYNKDGVINTIEELKFKHK